MVGSQIQAVVNVIEIQEKNEQNINPIPFTATTVDEINPTLNYSMTGEQLSMLMQSTPRHQQVHDGDPSQHQFNPQFTKLMKIVHEFPAYKADVRQTKSLKKY